LRIPEKPVVETLNVGKPSKEILGSYNPKGGKLKKILLKSGGPFKKKRA